MDCDDRRVVLSWSGGKDSALALQALRAEGYKVVSLLTTVAGEYDRISHHGVRSALLEDQARAVGVPLHRVNLPVRSDGACSNGDYEEAMREALQPYFERGLRTVAFGDINLEDIRAYREARLAEVGMNGLFPLWGACTRKLAERFIADGFKAYLSCVSLELLGEAFAGRSLDAALLSDLPEGVDPCGENGEYHSFVYDGPVFSRPVCVRVGKKVLRDVRCFADLLPVSGDPATTSDTPDSLPPDEPPTRQSAV